MALITGASRGIGAAVAERFAAEGAILFLVARTVGGLEETDDRARKAGSSATLVPFDLTEGEAIDRLGGTIAERHGKLDILVANAGVLGHMGPIGHQSPQQWEQAFAVNVTANWRLIRSCDALLRASDGGRAIFVSSRVAEEPYAYFGAYGASKAALNMMVKTYAAEITKTNVKANLLDPGPIRTRMRADAFPGEDPMSLPPPEALTDLFVTMAEPAFTRNGEVMRAYQRRGGGPPA